MVMRVGVVGARGRMGREVIGAISEAPDLYVAAEVDLGRDGEVVGPVDGLDDRAAHAATSAQDADADHRAEAKLVVSSNGPTTARALGRASTSDATARMSSCVTASMAASVSSTGSSRG